MRHRDGSLGLLLFGQADAFTGMCPVQGMPPISGRPPAGEVLWKSGEFGTISGTQIFGELVFDLTGGTRRDRRRGAAGRRNREHGNRCRKDQWSRWKVEGRHLDALCSLLTVSSWARSDAASDLVAILASLPMPLPKL
jgi:hypothetical protein